MLRSWKIGKAFGIGIYIHWSFLLLLVVSYFAFRGGGPTAALFVLSFMLSVFSCVLLHELGHALMARYFGIPTRDITLLPIGGVARLEWMSEKPGEEFWIAVAGPAVNVVIAGVLLGFILLLRVPVHIMANQQIDSPMQLLPYLGFRPTLILCLLIANVFLVVFNMIPAFPMDGGRVFRALLTSQMGHLRATEVAAAISVVLASLMGLYGVYLMLRPEQPQFTILPLVAMFVFFAGQQELAAVRYRAAQRRGPAPDVPGPYVLPSAPPPEPNFSGFTWDRQHRLWIEWRGGRPVHACWVPSE